MCASPEFRLSGLTGLAGFAALVLAFFAAPVLAQNPVDALEVSCTQGGGSQAACQDGALAYRGIQTGLGLLLTGGTDLPGGASTLGWRVPHTPRMALFTRFKGGHVGLPEILETAPGGGTEQSFFVGGWEFGAALGAFRGFSVSPTVGGILSLDLLGSVQWDMLPENPGFDGNGWNWSAGARLGILRESFTLPGISISARYAGLSDLEYGSPPTDTPGGVAMDLTARSVRAVVGKDLLAIGLLGGFGWDRYESSGSFSVPGATSGTSVTTPVSDFASDRTLFFGQATFTYLILQLSAELGWASGVDPLATPYGGSFDSTSGTGFGSLSARLTF